MTPTLSVEAVHERSISLIPAAVALRFVGALGGCVSGGVAASPEHGSTAAELVRAADDALYAAKQAGRDRVVSYQAKKSSE